MDSPDGPCRPVSPRGPVAPVTPVAPWTAGALVGGRGSKTSYAIKHRLNDMLEYLQKHKHVLFIKTNKQGNAAQTD